jgi:UDP-glucose 4-epimerase
VKVIVTGGAGFIGANLCRTLVATPGVEEVVALDDLSTGSRANLEGVDGVALVEGSILDPDLLATIVPGAHAIVHLGARPSVPRSLIDPMAAHEAHPAGPGGRPPERKPPRNRGLVIIGIWSQPDPA